MAPSRPTPPTEPTPTWDSLAPLLSRMRPKLERILGYYQIPPHDAEDLIQDSILTLLLKWEAIHSPEAWILATLKRRCLMYWRSVRIRRTDGVDGDVLERLAAPAPPAQGQADLRHDLERAFRDLAPHQQHLLVLRYGHGCRPAELADRLGYRDASIRKVTSRCLGRLHRRLEAGGYGG